MWDRVKELEAEGKVEVICPGTLKAMKLNNGSSGGDSSGSGFNRWAELVLSQGEEEVNATARLVVVRL